MTKEFFHYHKDNEKNTFLYKTLDKFCKAEMRRSMYGKKEKKVAVSLYFLITHHVPLIWEIIAAVKHFNK